MGLQLGYNICRVGLNPGCFGRCSVLGVVLVLDLEESLSSAFDSDVQSFDTVDRGILDHVLCRLGLPGWFRHAYFEYHAHVRRKFKLSCGLGESWTRDGGIPQGCPLSMIFTVALFLPWCRNLESCRRVWPQLDADNQKCVSTCDHDFLRLPGSLIRIFGWLVRPLPQVSESCLALPRLFGGSRRQVDCQT